MTATLTLLQLTDLHLLAEPEARLLGVDTEDSLRAVLDRAFAEHQPDAVLATGDITHHGDPVAYQRFDRAVADYFSGPLLVLPGNHDESAAMAGYFEQLELLEIANWSIIGVDSHEDGQPGALLTADGEAQLRQQCLDAAARGQRTLIATHHPVVEVGCPWLDKDRIQNAHELLEWLAERTTVAAVVFGHAHQEIERGHRHIRLFGTPATCFQFQPDSSSFAIDMDPARGKPGYRWLMLHEDGSVTTQVKRVEDYPLEIEMPPRR